MRAWAGGLCACECMGTGVVVHLLENLGQMCVYVQVMDPHACQCVGTGVVLPLPDNL